MATVCESCNMSRRANRSYPGMSKIHSFCIRDRL
ncbi:MAG: zinc-finger domain-containing protein [Nitrosomonas sp.]|nr:zinc-finger domain-containing protein [Nitrosomonas sp.]